MKPHTESIVLLTEFVLYELGRYIRPRPNWHDPNLNAHSECWVWKGEFTPTTKANGEDFTNKRYSYTGAMQRKMVTKAALPIHRIGKNRTLLVHRFLYYLFRNPPLPVSKMIPLDDYGDNLKPKCFCVNPWHWEAHLAEKVKRGHDYFPDDSTLRMLPEFLTGEFAADEHSLAEKAKRELGWEIDYKERLGKTHAIIPHDDFVRLGGTVGGVKSEDKEVGEVRENIWLIDQMGKPWVGVPENYNAVSDYIVKLRPWVDISVEGLSDHVRQELEWFSLPLPIYHYDKHDDYWIRRNNIEAGEELFQELVEKRVKTGSEILRECRKDRFHIRLVLLALGTCRPIDIKDIDWTK